MTASIYKATARKSSRARGTVFALGREDRLHGTATANGGYVIFKLCENYAGHVRGGIAKTWRVAAEGLTYAEAIQKMNDRLGRVEFEPIPQEQIKGYRAA